MTQAELIADELDRAVRGQAWHGSSLTELLGDITFDEAVQRNEDWPAVGEVSADRWVAVQAALRQSHENLREAVAALDDDRLAQKAPQSLNSVYVLLHGVSQHAAYHGGQIALLKKAIVTRHRRAAL